MHNLEDYLLIDSFRIPWLIWIQLLILLLIILLLSYSADLPPAAASPPEVLSSAADAARSCSQELNHEAREQRPTEFRDGESNTEQNASSVKDLQRLFHPCYYIEIAKQAFLQCLGLSYPPSNSRERRRDE